MASLIPSAGASGTGSMTLQGPNTNSNQTATLPDATGTVMVSGNMPAFSAYLSANQTGLSNNTWTKVTFDTKEFDTNNNFSSSRFTPTIAGYYQINSTINCDASTTNPVWAGASLYKNGTFYKQSRFTGMTYTSVTPQVSSVVYMNGTTDYLEMYVYFSGATGPQIDGGSSYLTYFNGILVRAA